MPTFRVENGSDLTFGMIGQEAIDFRNDFILGLPQGPGGFGKGQPERVGGSPP